MQKVTILGSTGSIGVSTLNVLAQHAQLYTVEALTAHRNVDKLVEQCVQFKPRYAVIADKAYASALSTQLKERGCATQVLAGEQALIDVAEDEASSIVVAAIVGAVGLLPTLAAVRASKRVLLANKEPLVMAGGLFLAALKKSQAQLIPVDSEHNAIFQCLPTGFCVGQVPSGVESLILTASGGPFRQWTVEQLKTATPQQACAHPNWSMGAKISVDSATMMNKGLELIEAYWLFGLPATKLEVVLHPQSVVHSLVRYLDGSLLAQLGQPDMRTPIACALAWPERIGTSVPPLDLLQCARLDFQPLSQQQYPCLSLAYQALIAGGDASVVLNAANEVAVAAFLAGKIAFTHIYDVVAYALDTLPVSSENNLEAILAVDQKARVVAENYLTQQCCAR